MQKLTPNQKERHAKIYMIFVSVLGWVLIFQSLLNLQLIEDAHILLLLGTFLWLAEFYPIPVWRGNSSLHFPIIYVMYLAFGLAYTVTLFASIVFVIYLIRRYPLRIVFFNPSQLILSFFLAVQLAEFFLPAFQSGFTNGVIHFVAIVFLYYLFNNLFVDIVLLLRPQVYTFNAWKQKMATEIVGAGISLSYGIIFYLVGTQNRGEIDIFSYFFFFSPLVGLALLSSMIARLKKEKNRLHSLFSISTKLNHMLPSDRWMENLADNLKEFIDSDAAILWIRENGEWKRSFEDGRVQKDVSLPMNTKEKFLCIKESVLYQNTTKEAGIAGKCFASDLHALLYTPLLLEDEMVGMLVVARSRTKSFTKDDVASLSTIANQLAVVIKTRNLFHEQERLLIFEERNRIARDIHDGVAQTLAGALMKLETAEKKFDTKKDETRVLLDESIHKMRHSLKELRDSIYALRPYPTARIGLSSAIMQKIDAVDHDQDLEIKLEIRGEEQELSPFVEKVMFEIFQESLQNSIKHGQSSRVDVLLSYQSEHVLVKVKDDGVGFSLYQAMIKARNRPHFGILNMNEAAEKINASIQIDSKEGEGTEITLLVPKLGVEGEETIDKSYASR
ncbi:Signal transduction histidine kinase [Thalassobacillus cyri]|uniref:histidine kinase n=1 Tax=Thalassobacillus cyri TaxID=571932 RepID=A0A1H3YV57_9BACI|nr:sensor histidine kinase [Thalassobacillus cyri]SEA14942.1 Signal transduction histidine kinase [Thalassobacillus cyri]